MTNPTPPAAASDFADMIGRKVEVVRGANKGWIGIIRSQEVVCGYTTYTVDFDGVVIPEIPGTALWLHPPIQSAQPSGEREVVDYNYNGDPIYGATRPAESVEQCGTCNGHGMIGGHTGQTPENFDQWEAPCPECNPVAESVAQGGEALIGAAFKAVLRNPDHKWRETGAQPFIDMVAQRAGELFAYTDSPTLATGNSSPEFQEMADRANRVGKYGRCAKCGGVKGTTTLLCDECTATGSGGEAGLPGNVITHRNPWRRALEMVRDASEPRTEDKDDRGYWSHELAAFDRTFDRLWEIIESGKRFPAPTVKGSAVYATVTGITSEDGKHELYTITEQPFPLSDPWKLYTHPAPAGGGAGDSP